MEFHNLALASFLLTGWGVLYSVSLGWSIYALLDQWPRLIRFAFIWRKGFLRFRPGQHFGRMTTCWLLILVLVFVSLACVVSGALQFERSGWSASVWFPLIYALVGLAVFIIPHFINRAVWGFALLLFPKQYQDLVMRSENRIYWQMRFSPLTAQKIYIDPKYAGKQVFLESLVGVGILSWAVSGWYPNFLLSYDQYWILAPIIAMIVAFLAHFAWPEHVPNVDYENLPSSLRGQLEERFFQDSGGHTWLAYIVNFQPSVTYLPGTDRIRSRRLVFCRTDGEDVFETKPPSQALSEISLDDLKNLLETAKQQVQQTGHGL